MLGNVQNSRAKANAVPAFLSEGNRRRSGSMLPLSLARWPDRRRAQKNGWINQVL